MKWFGVAVSSRQRVSLGKGGERAYLTTSHPVIPGSVIRGALAAAWTTMGGPRDREFRNVFERARFSPLLPTGVRVAGQSVRICKYHSAAGHARHHDEAFEGTLSADDQGCRGRERCNGGYLTHDLGQPAFVTLTSTALIPRQHVASTGQLFSREAIEKGTRFSGYIVLPDDTPDTRLRTLTTLFIGGRSSVLGRCDISFTALPGAPLPAMDADSVVVRTLSPSLLVDDVGAPTTDLLAALQRAGLDVRKVWAHRVEAGSAGGWHAASGLPKPAEIALAPGATAVLRSPDQAVLSRLLDRGIGLRRSEGYGWLEVVAPQHPGPTTATPGAPQAAADTVAPPSSAWSDYVAATRLTSQQLQWVANLLRTQPAGHDLTAEDLAEPGAGRLSTPQLSRVRETVRDVPQGDRNSLAFVMTRGAG